MRMRKLQLHLKLHLWIAIACVTIVLAAANPAQAYWIARYDARGNYTGCAHFPNDGSGINDYTVPTGSTGEFFCWYLKIAFADAIAARPDLTNFTDGNGTVDSRVFFNHFELRTDLGIRAAVADAGREFHSQSSDLRRVADELDAASRLTHKVGAPEIATGLARIARLPPPPPAVISSCSPSVAAGDEMCVCGTFPAPESGLSLQLGGQPLGTPEAQSKTTLFFRVPDTLAVGSYLVTPAAGSPPAAAGCSVTVLNTTAVLDVQTLELTGEAFLTLRVLGTTDPVELRIENRSPTVVLINGSNFQRITTSGGINNVVRRRVRLLRSGTLHIAFEIVEPSCPCVFPSIAGNQRTGQAEMIRQLVY